ncbi:NAD(P)/FAD-dependent oxidoreductase [Loigolactobacillus binensis]|uniref:FAD-dependent oxidoreductase n=1 Tax=Loigolactobacillus binensis TaxID=2559922 RepID=A0ABW3EDW8_9LACO|nr:NAD(P)/FAD-dependent oxidoreductase [Loigolactobacillus binensis]
MNFTNLFESKKIGTLEIKNRYVMPAMGTSYGNLSGEPSQQSIDYYTERASGGFGLIIVEVTAVTKDGICTPGQLGLWNNEFDSSWHKLTNSVHQNGAKIAVQLQHSGRQTSAQLIGHQPVSSSAIACPVFDEVPRALTKPEILDLIEKFGDAAKRAKNNGFDAVEIHGAHGYLVAQFLSPQVNKRTDEYGGSIRGRAKFACDIIHNIKQKCGADFPVIFRISGTEKIPGGLDISQTKQISSYLEEAGADAINVSICTYASLDYMFMPQDTPSGFNVENAHQIKQVVNIPVIAVGRLNTPEIQKEVVDNHQADFVALGRESIADPHFPDKVKAGNLDEISPCISCLQSCVGYLMDPNKLKISCLVNPRTGHEGQYKFTPTTTPKKIMIVGGGPAGLLSAWILAKRGHKVNLYEKGFQLGGQFRIGAIPPAKSLLNSAIKYYLTMGAKYGVNYHLNCPVDQALLTQENPDITIIATGGTPLIPNITGIHNSTFKNAIDVIDAKQTVGKNCLIVGGGMVGAETADFLREHNRQATIIELKSTIASDTILGVHDHLLNRLENGHTEFILGATVKKFTGNDNNDVIYEQNGVEKCIGGFDDIILAMGVRSYNPLKDALTHTDTQVYTIGDANKPGQANNATEAAMALANQL